MVSKRKASRLMDPSPLAFTLAVIQKWSDRAPHNRWTPSALSSSRSSKIRFRDLVISFVFGLKNYNYWTFLFLEK